ncbi:hypothetical protein WUBG_16845 [Wuchereria bancrofti]|uniref:Uncharacterized protein n=1 Tax=Wuchereria bancrofti TaxID=6293 RepID=J9AE12_WUCBA|nr:hypothetical protein WUBG_16845 [Wuchereria bancrofti]
MTGALKGYVGIKRLLKKNLNVCRVVFGVVFWHHAFLHVSEDDFTVKKLTSLDCNQDVAEVLFPNIIPMLSQLGSSVFIIELRVSFLVYFLVFNGRPVQISALEMIWEWLSVTEL